MALSEFSFSLEFIPGVDNDIADSLSRLCRNHMIDSPKEYSPEYILSALHIESYKPSPSQYTKIGMMHNTVVGHYGLERTLKRFKDLNDTWEYQRQHIRYYIDHCPCCQKMNMPIHAHGFTTSTVINVISDMLSLILPSVFSILETFKRTYKSKVANH